MRKLFIKYFVLLFILISNLSFANHAETSADMQKIRDFLIKEIPDLESMSTYDKAVSLRNFVYSHVQIGGPGEISTPFTYKEFDEIIQGQRPLLCQGLTLHYIALLNIFGIPARRVNLFSTNKAMDVHVATEVLIEDHWALLDPTFNVSWYFKNKQLGTADLYQLFQAGQNPEHRTDGFPLIQGRSIEEYYMPYKSLFSSYKIYNVNLWEDTDYPFVMLKVVDSSGSELYVDADISPTWTRVYSADFSQGIPNDWRTEGRLFQTKVKDQFFYLASWDYPIHHVLMSSSEFSCPAGDYHLIIDGFIKTGSIGVMLVNVAESKYINYCIYGLSKQSVHQLACDFKVPEHTTCVLHLFLGEVIAGEISTFSLSKVLLLKEAE